MSLTIYSKRENQVEMLKEVVPDCTNVAHGKSELKMYLFGDLILLVSFVCCEMFSTSEPILAKN